MKHILTFVLILLFSQSLHAQTKILFDATKAESAGNADWVIDADLHNIGYTGGLPVVGDGSESNPQRLPTPLQSTVTSSTSESYWMGGLSAWGIDLVKKGYYVETLPYNGSISYGNSSNAQDLSNYKVFIVCEPNIVFTTTEKTAIMNFVQNGGGLMMVSDHTGSDRNNDSWDSPMIWNDLMSNNGIQSNPFGMTFDYADFSQTTTNIPTLPGDPLLHGIMGDVTQAMWSGGTTITLSPTSNSTIKGVVYKTGASFGNSNAMVAYAAYGNGKVVGVGDSSPCDDGTGDSGDQLYDGWIADANGNHEKLLMNATIWLAAGSIVLPTVTTQAASSIATTGATLNGTVNPNGVAATYHFEWGTTTSYGNSTTTQSAGSSGTSVSVSTALAGLTYGTTYHFRLVAVNTNGTINGSDLAFTTLTPAFSVSPSNQNVTSPAGSTSFTVTSNSSWTASSNQSWCSVTASGSGNGTIAANFSANSAVAQRVANITVTVTGAPPVVVTVTQAAGSPALSVSPPNQSVTAIAGSTSFSVTSNAGWAAASDQTWCVVTASGSGNGTISAVYSENIVVSPRVANITVTVSGLTPVVVTVSQAAATPTLVVTPSNRNVAHIAGSTTFSVTSNTGWTAGSDQTWCTVTASGSGNGTITADYLDNVSLASRVAQITVAVSGLTPVVVAISQAAVTLMPEPTNYPANFTPYNISVNWTDATGDVPPQGYIVRMSSVGYDDIAAPVNGVPIPNGPNDKNVPAGVQLAWFINLQPATMYYFKIFGYTGSGTGILYKTDGTIPHTMISTMP
jgi:hypothetical protein